MQLYGYLAICWVGKNPLAERMARGLVGVEKRENLRQVYLVI
jgi:hypothetical protein